MTPQKGERSFFLHDTSLMVSASVDEPARQGRFQPPWSRPDWETYNRLVSVLQDVGFTTGSDPRIDKSYPSLSSTHMSGVHGDLRVVGETYPTGCKFEFYQELVTINPNGGRYDFDRRQKMPYLVGKRFELVLRAARAHLGGRGFVERTKVENPNPDPLAYFNDQWDSEYEKRRGTHRFKRDETGWPAPAELHVYNREDRDGALISQGDLRYARDYSGRLIRGRVYGGINGLWMMVYGPGPRDATHLPAQSLFTCSPAFEPRRDWRSGGMGSRDPIRRLREEMKRAVATEHFERAAAMRDALKRLDPSPAHKGA